MKGPYVLTPGTRGSAASAADATEFTSGPRKMERKWGPPRSGTLRGGPAGSGASKPCGVSVTSLRL